MTAHQVWGEYRKREQLATVLFDKVNTVLNADALHILETAWASLGKKRVGKRSGMTQAHVNHVMPEIGFVRRYVLNEKYKTVPVWVRDS